MVAVRRYEESDEEKSEEEEEEFDEEVRTYILLSALI